MMLTYRAGGDEYVECYYHTQRWIELVEQGFTTMWVYAGVALMLRQRKA